jgi:hypothetical protein
MAQMPAREDPSVAKIGIRKHLREQPINQRIQLYDRHTWFLS